MMHAALSRSEEILDERKAMAAVNVRSGAIMLTMIPKSEYAGLPERSRTEFQSLHDPSRINALRACWRA